ncbi:beta-glucosidase [Verticillium alfalfae VaMs.102]|uniref:beta-glucosidase n=1 Tax=Verticillium alfalfae (strain VaMs.102 / ATCC MYA-4576 / FGSC 10136) TaxID=526221 RepID=C9SYK8_VERA1|nr:beta-glucosidase [Verticillium alfalfae VaMs.102]EEY23873.1 beta-glucosidase [Verticillium alfalfae VaMs.102]
MLKSLVSGLLGLAAISQVVAQDEPIVDDSFFFGQAPAVYPTPELSPDGPWSDALAKAKTLINQMTLEEKYWLQRLDSRHTSTWVSWDVPRGLGQQLHETVEGIQENGVMTSTKPSSIKQGLTDLFRPFYDAVHAGTANIMCSYNRLNNSYACQNSKSQNGLLKEELGFQGGVASALSGLDVAMPNGAGKFGSSLVEAVSNGSLPEAQIDNMATRLIASWFHLKQNAEGFPKAGNGMAQRLWEPHSIVDARTKCSKPTLFDGAVEGHVLVKNEKNALPLRSENMKLISLFGYSARAPSSNTPVPAANGTRFASWEMGIQSANITEVDLGWFGNLDLPTSDIAINGTLISAGGSAAPSWSLISAPYDALVAQAYEDGTALYHDFESGDPSVNPNSDACIVIGNVWATEGYDRPSLRDQYTDKLILNVANKCANTIVVFHNAGPRLVDSFIEHPNVTSVIFAHLPGQDSGRALISLLYGQENFSGRLPYTVARNESDYGDLLKPYYTSRDAPSRFRTYPQSNFVEGTFVDYRDFDSKKVDPRFEFGFGLSYTTFNYSFLKISKTNGSLGAYPTGPVIEGGNKDLWDELVIVEADVTNSGKVDGMEVAQLYLGIPGDEHTPLKQLRGFEKQLIKVGETATIKFPLRRRDLSVWNVEAQKWHLQEGEYRVSVGKSSRDLPLKGILVL